MSFALALERGNSYIIAVKGMFALSLVMLIYNNTIMTFIDNDLTSMVLFGAVLLSILSILKPVDYTLNKILTFRFDNKFPEGSISFQETLKEPQWENFYNNIVGDIYLVLTLLVIILKLCLNPNFILNFSDNPDFFYSSFNILNISIIYFDIFLLYTVSTRCIRNVRKNKIKLILSQQFLSYVNTGGDLSTQILDNIKNSFLNNQWFLFRQFYRDYYNEKSHFEKDFIKRLKDFKENGEEVTHAPFKRYGVFLNEYSLYLKKHKLLFCYPFHSHSKILNVIDELIQILSIGSSFETQVQGRGFTRPIDQKLKNSLTSRKESKNTFDSMIQKYTNGGLEDFLVEFSRSRIEATSRNNSESIIAKKIFEDISRSQLKNIYIELIAGIYNDIDKFLELIERLDKEIDKFRQVTLNQ